jgi:catechol 2,3-dioxygenase-like lactoylglutathione lyase family enzyme
MDGSNWQHRFLAIRNRGMTQEHAMLSYVTIGANHIQRSERFYSSILCPLGYERKEEHNAVVYSLGPNTIYVKIPYDGREATVGNGSMLAFKAANQKLVRDLHAAGRQAGGSDEGAPGFRDDYSAQFYVGYLRDDVGNKIALFCNNPDEPSRAK